MTTPPPTSGAPAIPSVEEQTERILAGGLREERNRAATPAEQAAAARRALGVKQQLDSMATIRDAIIKGRMPPVEAITALMKSYQTLYDQAGAQSMQSDTLAMQQKIAFLKEMKSENFNMDMAPQKALAGLVGMVNMVGFIAKICDKSGVEGAGEISSACTDIVKEWQKGNDYYAATNEFDELKGTMAPQAAVAAKLAQAGTGAALGAYDSNMPDILRQFQERLNEDLKRMGSSIKLEAPAAPAGSSGAPSAAPTQRQAAPAGGAPQTPGAQAEDPWAQTRLVLQKYVKDLKLDPASASGILGAIRAAAGDDNKLQPAERGSFEITKAAKALTPAQREDLYNRLGVIGVAPQPT